VAKKKEGNCDLAQREERGSVHEKKLKQNLFIIGRLKDNLGIGRGIAPSRGCCVEA